MFGIVWLRRGSPVNTEISILTSQAEVIASAKSRAPGVARRHPGKEPDSFRLTDAAGKVIGVFQIGLR
jgi:hypothetical protein